MVMLLYLKHDFNSRGTGSYIEQSQSPRYACWLKRNAPWFAWLIPAVVNGRAVMTSEDASVGVSVPQ